MQRTGWFPTAAPDFAREVPALVWSVIGFIEVMYGLPYTALPYTKIKDSE